MIGAVPRLVRDPARRYRKEYACGLAKLARELGWDE
jgi:hypothetical protein